MPIAMAIVMAKAMQCQYHFVESPAEEWHANTPEQFSQRSRWWFVFCIPLSEIN